LSRDDAYSLISVAADFAVTQWWTCARASTAWSPRACSCPP